MKIITWNIWVKNQNPIGNLKKLIADENPDVICLQEVTADVLEYIHDGNFSDYDYIYGFDYRKHKGGYYQNYYLVTLSKYPIQNQKVNKIHVNHITRWSLWDMIMKWDESIEFLYADINVDGELFRVFNSHLEVSAGPKLRLNQFDQILDKFSVDSTNIVCGDFNIYAKPKISILIWWLMGFSPMEIFINERGLFNKLWADNDLFNPHENIITFPHRSLQLDHVIIPKSKTPVDSGVADEIYGSDHYPVVLEI